MSSRQRRNLSKKEDCSEVSEVSEEQNRSKRQRKSVFSSETSVTIEESDEKHDSEAEQPKNKIRKTYQTRRVSSKKEKPKVFQISEETLVVNPSNETTAEISEPDLTNNNEIFIKKLLRPSPKLLNYFNEDKKLYKFLDQKKKSNIRYDLVPFRAEWGKLNFPHLSMKLIETQNKPSIGHYKYEKPLKEMTTIFYDLCQLHNEEELIKMLTINPTHLESLYRWAFLMRLKEENPKLHYELIERCIYIFEKSKCAGFSFYNGKCLLPYKRYENRIFHLSLFVHCLNLHEMCYYQACLEVCKILLNLDPDDPLGVLCIIDFYFIKTKKYQQLIDFYEKNSKYDLNALPNMRFSYILCLFLSHIKCEKIIQQTLIDFPHFFIYLRDVCSAIVPAEILKHPLFNVKLDDTNHVSLSLMGMYLNHGGHIFFREERFLQLLYTEAYNCIVQYGENSLKKSSFKTFSSYPNSLLRHAYISKYSDKYINIGMSKISMNIMMTDPFPPLRKNNKYYKPVKLTGI